MRSFAVLALFVCTGASAQEWRSGYWRGQEVVFKVVDGLAIAEGDMILGSADEVTAANPRDSKTTSLESVARNSTRFLWPNGVVPYVIDSNLPTQQRITDAIQHWNEKTPIQLVRRTNEASYVRFIQRPDGCSSSVGMIGREQTINLAGSCGTGAVIHEIGHAVGLFHEQSRHDRDFYVRVDLQNIDKREASNFSQHLTDGRDLGGYDYGSIMHYSSLAFSRNGKPVIQTVPAGIPIDQRDGLSPEDIDAVKRLYGYPIDGVTVSTNPVGLEIEVDGERFRSPRTFNWQPGSQHAIGVPAVQLRDAYRYVFGRWSDEGLRTHSIVVSSDTSVYTANLIQQYKLPVGVAPAASGQLIVSPPSDDGYYAMGTELEITPVPADGYYFRQWSGFGLFNTHGVSPNPLRIVVNNALEYTANFTRTPPTTITSEPPGLEVVVDGKSMTTPQSFAWAAGSSHTIGVDKTNQNTALSTARHSFLGWNDGGDATHTIAAGAAPATFAARFQTQYLLARQNSQGGFLDVSPASSDNYYDAGSTIQIVPNAAFDYRFFGWTGDLTGSDAPGYLTIDDHKIVSATFALPGNLASNSVVNAANMLNIGGVAPGSIVTIFGVELGPEKPQTIRVSAGRADTVLENTRVYFDDIPAPLIYVSPNQLSAVVPYAIAGRGQTTVRVTRGGFSSNGRAVAVLPASPAIFTANSSGKGPAAALNQDGSFNSLQNPARKSSVVVLYATGEGETIPASLDGRISAAPLPRPKLPVSVRIAGRQAQVDFAGSAPGLIAGVMQVNVRIPDDCPSGAVPVVLSAGEYSSIANVSVFVQ